MSIHAKNFFYSVCIGIFVRKFLCVCVFIYEYAWERRVVYVSRFTNGKDWRVLVWSKYIENTFY